MLSPALFQIINQYNFAGNKKYQKMEKEVLACVEVVHLSSKKVRREKYISIICKYLRLAA